MIAVFAEPLTKDFYSNLCSFSYLVYIFFVIFCIVFPFLAAFASERFWIRSIIHKEKPIVVFNNEYQLFFLINNKTHYYSTFNELNENFPRKIASPSVYFSTKDNDFDGYIDQFNLKINVPNNLDLSGDGNRKLTNQNFYDYKDIQGFKLAIYFDYGFNVSSIL